MMTVSEKLEFLAETKRLIREAINKRGGKVELEAAFRTYVTSILELNCLNDALFTKLFDGNVAPVELLSLSDAASTRSPSANAPDALAVRDETTVLLPLLLTLVKEALSLSDAASARAPAATAADALTIRDEAIVLPPLRSTFFKNALSVSDSLIIELSS